MREQESKSCESKRARVVVRVVRVVRARVARVVRPRVVRAREPEL